jgi:hypothetical protein
MRIAGAPARRGSRRIIEVIIEVLYFSLARFSRIVQKLRPSACCRQFEKPRKRRHETNSLRYFRRFRDGFGRHRGHGLHLHGGYLTGFRRRVLGREVVASGLRRRERRRKYWTAGLHLNTNSVPFIPKFDQPGEACAFILRFRWDGTVPIPGQRSYFLGASDTQGMTYGFLAGLDECRLDLFDIR